MILSDYQVDPENPLNDPLDRGEYIPNLTKLVISYDSLVLSIDSPWGGGKTTFLKMWSKYVQKEEICKVVEFNAWENDFTKDAFASLISELHKQVFKEYSGDKKATEAIQSAASLIARRAIPLVVKLFTGLSIDLEKGVEKILEDLSEGVTNDLLKEYERDKTEVKNFKENLRKFIKSLNSKSHLMIFIDELDRCRPDFAREVLEVVKHLFDIKGVIFVIATDQSQLGHSLKTVYGSEMNVEGYLKRFFDLEFTLPEYNVDAFFKTVDNQLLLKKDTSYNSGVNFIRYLRILNDFLKEFKNGFYLQLRDVQKIFINFQIVVSQLPNNESIEPYFLSLLLMYKETDKENYNYLLNGEYDLKILFEELKGKAQSDNFKNSDIAHHLFSELCFMKYGYEGGFSKIIKPGIEDEVDRNGFFKNVFSHFKHFQYYSKYHYKIRNDYRHLLNLVANIKS